MIFVFYFSLIKEQICCSCLETFWGQLLRFFMLVTKDTFAYSCLCGYCLLLSQGGVFLCVFFPFRFHLGRVITTQHTSRFYIMTENQSL